VGKRVRQFFILTFLWFLLVIAIIGLFLFVLDMPGVGNALQTLGAWTATFVFLAMFKKIHPDTSVLAYLKKQFTGKIRAIDMFGSLLFFAIILIGTAGSVAIVQEKSVFDVLILDPGILFVSFFTCLIKGPMGEELGWRSFVLNELEHKHGLAKAAVINGLLWGIWHIPLILVSGYTAAETLIQIVCNIVALIALVIVMALLYKQSKNLLVPILVHQFFNYTVGLVMDETMVSNIAITFFTCIAAIVFWFVYAENRCPENKVIQ
jgi:membrane protease YdiL (CAAX protease family)